MFSQSTTCACAYVKHVLTGDNSDISTSISIRRTKHVRSSCAYAYVFEFSLAYAGVYAYAYICAYSLVKTSLHYTVSHEIRTLFSRFSVTPHSKIRRNATNVEPYFMG